MSRRFAAALAALTAVAGLLAGCTPGPEPILALRAGAGGTLEALVYLCAGDELTYLSLYDRDVSKGWKIEDPPASPTPGPAADQVAVYPLFVTPPGWSRTKDSLSAVEPGRRYGLTSLTRSGEDGSLFLEVGDLDRLQGKVLVTGDDGTELVDEAEFRRRAAGTCPAKN